MDIIAIVLSLFLLVTFAYRGFSVILFAPIFALFVRSVGTPLCRQLFGAADFTGVYGTVHG